LVSYFDKCRETDCSQLLDGHNDLMIFMRGKYQNHIYDNEFQEKFENGGLPQHVDIPRLEKGLQGGAFWSAFWPCPTEGNMTDFSDERYSSSK
jgi:membrane dipeptidase